MSARATLQAAVVARLGGLGMAVFDAPSPRRATPFAMVEEPMLVDWSTKSWTGREGRVVVVIEDKGERPVRLRDLSDRVETALETLNGDLGEGWRLIGARLVRGRIVRAGDDRWRATSEFMVRLYREH